LPRSGLLFVLNPPAARQLCQGQVAERGRCIARTNTRQEDIMSRRHIVHLVSWGARSSFWAARAGAPRAEILGRVPLAPRGIADCRWPETKGAATRAAPTRNIDYRLSTFNFRLSSVHAPAHAASGRSGVAAGSALFLFLGQFADQQVARNSAGPRICSASCFSMSAAFNPAWPKAGARSQGNRGASRRTPDSPEVPFGELTVRSCDHLAGAKPFRCLRCHPYCSGPADDALSSGAARR
jgi:hypothetical protein